MSSSSAEKLARWSSSPPASPRPRSAASLPMGAGGRSEDEGTSSLKGGEPYQRWLTPAHRDAVSALVEALRAAAPETTAEVIARPWAWAAEHELHPRFAHLVALDWRRLRRPRLESLERLVVALGLGPEAARILAATFPEAIAPEPR